MRLDRRRVFENARKEFEATKHRGASWTSCLKIAWAVERKIQRGREFYNPAANFDPDVMALWPAVEKAARAALSVRLNTLA